MNNTHITPTTTIFEGGIYMPIMKELNYDNVELLNAITIKDPLEAIVSGNNENGLYKPMIFMFNTNITYNVSCR